jgi:hypothetical protein
MWTMQSVIWGQLDGGSCVLRVGVRVIFAVRVRLRVRAGG